MFYPSVSSSGMCLVPVTNTQKSSGPRLRYKFFAGAKPARSHKEDLHHVGIIDYGGVRAGMGCVCGHRLGCFRVATRSQTGQKTDLGPVTRAARSLRLCKSHRLFECIVLIALSCATLSQPRLVCWADRLNLHGGVWAE